MTTNPAVRMITDEDMASWCDADGNYNVTIHAASLTDAALLSALASTPASAIGSPLYVALVAERDARDANAMLTSRLVLSAPLGRPYARTLGHTVRLRPLGILTRTRRGVTTVKSWRAGAGAFGVIGANVKGA